MYLWACTIQRYIPGPRDRFTKESSFSYLRYLCLLVRSCIQHLLCFVFRCVCLRLVFCLSNVASVSGLSILDCPFGFL
jgi:hypothetical protein